MKLFQNTTQLMLRKHKFNERSRYYLTFTKLCKSFSFQLNLGRYKIYICLHIHIRICRYRVRLVNCGNVLFLVSCRHIVLFFFILSTGQYRRSISSHFVRQRATWRNSVPHRFGNGMIYRLGFATEHLLRIFQSVRVSIWWQCRGFEKS